MGNKKQSSHEPLTIDEQNDLWERVNKSEEKLSNVRDTLGDLIVFINEAIPLKDEQYDKLNLLLSNI